MMNSSSEQQLIDERGPNGGPVRIKRNGDKVERPPGERWDLLLRRGANQIVRAEKEYREKTWWVRWVQMNVLRKSRHRALVLTPQGNERAKANAARIETKYDGVVDLDDEYVDFYLGMVVGKLEALRWVLGYEWDSVDTSTSVRADLHPHRTDDEIHDVVGELWDKVWWNRKQVMMENIVAGKEPVPAPAHWTEIEAAIAEVEERYGFENLGWDDFDWGRLNGKFSALRWVTGEEWDFLDT